MPNDHDACVGPLDAGTHSSVLFDPPLTFEVPAGWANHADSPGEYVLVRTRWAAAHHRWRSTRLDRD